MKNSPFRINILNEYDVVVGVDLLGQIDKLFDLQKYSKIFVVTDKNLANFFNDFKLKGHEKIILKSGEKHKNIQTVEYIWEKLSELGADRKSLVINFGGGVIGDMGGFAASTFMRGIDFLQIPTTLLSQVDASVGGKVGVNFMGIKNLIGAFNQPIGVLCDISLLKTLPDREFIEGFGEVIKYGIIADEQFFNFVTSKKPRQFNQNELVEIVKKSCQMKKQIIENDITEQNTRRLVNFGHTIGHALESLSFETDAPLLHGEAVSIGMVAEAKISVLKGMISQKELEKIIDGLERASLPIKYKNIDAKKALKKVRSDKKSERGIVYFTLISSIGKAETGQQVEDDVLIESLKFIEG